MVVLFATLNFLNSQIVNNEHTIYCQKKRIDGFLIFTVKKIVKKHYFLHSHLKIYSMDEFLVIYVNLFGPGILKISEHLQNYDAIFFL